MTFSVEQVKNGWVVCVLSNKGSRRFIAEDLEAVKRIIQTEAEAG